MLLTTFLSTENQGRNENMIIIREDWQRFSVADGKLFIEKI